MSGQDVIETLKNMSGDELAQVQNSLMLATDLHPSERACALELISQEVCLRQSESIGRKAGRFWNRHGEKIGMFAIGALIGSWAGE